MANSSTRPPITRLADYAFRLPGYLLGSASAQTESVLLRHPPRRLLIVKVHGMGDSVLVRAIIELLQREHPALEIGVMTGPATRELMTTGLGVRNHGYSQKRVTPASIASALRDIRCNSYDAVANFEQGSLAGTAFLALSGIRTRLGFVRTAGDPKSRLLTHRLRFRADDSMWKSFFRLARLLFPDLPEEVPSIVLRPSQETKRWAEQWWRGRVGGSERSGIALHLGCGPGMDFKRWPIDRFLRLAEQLNLRRQNQVFILTGTALEQDLIREFSQAFRGAAVDASDLATIENTALILERCRLLVSNDTGVMHLGAALGTPTVGLFGATSPAHWAPLGRRAAYARETELRCSPCVNNYLNLMPSSCTNPITAQCMSDISVESVDIAIQRALDGEPLSYELHEALA
jgi:heptosyltransferase-2